MKKYDNYKDSGIEWLGEIPEHWEVKPFKHLVICNSEALTEKTNPEMEINYIEIGDVNSFDGIKETSKYTFEKAPSRARRIVREGDVIISTVRTYLKAITSISSKFDGFIASTGFAVLTPKLIHSGFLGNIALCEGLIGEIISLSKGVSYPSITSQDLTNISIPFPSKNEQNAIANYLDHKTTQIDTLIAKKEQFISLLQEERTAVINQAVTKGLDPNVPMKDSGIEWLGEIPEHWEVKRMKYVIKTPLKYGANESAEDEILEDPRYIRITDFGNDGKLRKNTFKSLSLDKAENFLLEEGDILFARSGATVGKTFFFKDYKGVACFAGYLIKASCDPMIMKSEFLYEFTNSSGYENWKQSIFQQSTIQNIGADKYNQLKIGVPPIAEQQKIIDFITSKINEIDTLISKSQQEIELLKEYKTALISEVVTGKVDVRDVILN